MSDTVFRCICYICFIINIISITYVASKYYRCSQTGKALGMETEYIQSVGCLPKNRGTIQWN